MLAVYLESRVSSSSIRRIRTCIPSAISSRRHFQHLYAILRKCQVKVISFCQKKEYGSTRSIVRRLGTILSLEPSPRPYFQLVQDLGYDEQSIAPAPAAPSLADVLWVANDEGEASTRLKTEFWRKEKSAPYCGLNPPLDSIQTIPKSSAESDSLVGQAALQKISALEEELTFLRAQIAAVVSAQTLGSIPPQAFKAFSTLDGFYPVPAMTSTPLPISHNHFVIPSPPPLSSGALSGVDTCNSAIELIKQRRAARSSGSTAADGVDHQKTKSVPSMMDVLKDLNKVQLRAVERSPGGTPLSRPKKRQSSDWDPVALLTHALKQKFAHRNNYEDDSLDKENRSFDTSSFSSPEMPLVGRCSWKPNAKSSLTKTEEVKPVSVWKVEAHF
ncbi:PREDICTED: mitochondrial fission regulator 2 [Chaetura pelagica]|uniref:mitochondrial fission regulator 2 n=1 Tax=Chaetura pelagica TaxID=8897 RepID=UPI000523BFC5|nr:PREDICTED: mitochondrial fission regulator 2 [Chaetura pelagica]